jgi:Fe-S-cluster containining protein
MNYATPCPETNLAPEDSFQFDCCMCGACCRDDRYIALTPQDIFLLSRGLGMNSAGFLNVYCDVQRDAGLNGVPIASLRTPGGVCMFHENNLCSVHTARPACCRNYPVGTRIEPGGGMAHQLMRAAPGCGGFGRGPKKTVARWWRESGMQACLPGIHLMELAARAVTRRLSRDHRERLFNLLCDFDAPESGLTRAHTADFKTLYPELHTGIEAVLAHAPLLVKP